MNDKAGVRRLWRQAQTLEEIGELTARWLEGALPYCPFYGGSPDNETGPLISFLASWNRQGLVTVFSQPGQALDEEGSAQRACFEGYAQEVLVRRVAAMTLYTDLLVFIFPPGVVGGYQVPVTVCEYHPFTWLGSSGDVLEENPRLEEHLSEAGIAALESAWKVIAIDLHWGRNNYLWEQVSRILTSETFIQPFTITPSPYLLLDRDLVL